MLTLFRNAGVILVYVSLISVCICTTLVEENVTLFKYSAIEDYFERVKSNI